MENFFDNFCGGDPFWDRDLTWNTTVPSFTRCFQKTIPIWIPAAFLLLFAPFEAYFLLKTNRSHNNNGRTLSIPMNSYNLSRLISVFCLILVNIVQFLHDLYYFTSLLLPNNESATDSSKVYYSTVADLSSSLFNIFTFSLFAFLVYLQRIRGVHTSGTAWFFTFLSLIFLTPNIYMAIVFGYEDVYFQVGTTNSSVFQFYLFAFHTLLVVIIFLLTCFADTLPKDDLNSSDNLIINEINDKKIPEEDFVNSFELRSPYQEANGEAKATLPDLQQPLMRTESQGSNPVDAVLEPPKVCPEVQASFLSRLTFWWFNPMAITGFRKSLTMDDLWLLNPNDTTKNLAPEFDRNWYGQEKKSSSDLKYTRTRTLSNESQTKRLSVAIVDPSIHTAKKGVVLTIFRTFGLYFFSGAIFKFLHDILQFAQPQLLSLFIGFISSSNEPVWHGFFIAAMFLVVSTTQSVMVNYYFNAMYCIALRVRTVLISAIYRKSLQLSNAARRETTSGEIVNLMSVDVQRFVDLLPFINLIWSAPFQICLTIYYLWMELGPSVIAGLMVMVLMIPINGFISTYQRRLQVNLMKRKDERVKVINELLNGIRVIKLYAWEIPFIRKVNSIRDNELNHLMRISYIGSVTAFLWTCTPFLVSFVTFAIYVLSSNENVLDAKKAFVSLSLFNLLRFPLTMLPQMITSMVMASVSVKRLNHFLNLTQLDPYVNKDAELPDQTVAVIEDGTFFWSGSEEKKTKETKTDNPAEPEPEQTKLLENAANGSKPPTVQSDAFTLKSINLSIKQGSLVAIVGHVGSGKSSLLSVLLGEMECLSGSVSIDRSASLAYVSQQAWIQNATLKENILFGNRYIKSRYRAVIEMCALKPDIAMLPGGDETEIGEKGINLSGGQKQRVAIARACYSNSDLILLDDPLSAVDAHVAQHIFTRVIKNGEGYLSGRTRVLVTNNIALLPEVDQIVVLSNGSVSEVGTYQQLIDNSGKFADFVREYSSHKDKEDVSSQEPQDDLSIKRSASVSKSEDNQSSKKEDNKIIETERTETGHVKLSVYMNYFRSLTYCWLMLMFMGFIGMQATSVGSNLWLAVWSNDKPANETGFSGDEIELRNHRLTVYGILGLSQAIFVLIGAISMAKGTVHSARILHTSLLDRIMRSPMYFFDTTPLGRIVNRFSKDIDTIDSTIPHTIRGWIICFLQVISTFLLISIEVPKFLFVALQIVLLYYFIQKFYVATSRQLKRLDSVTRSPIYSHFGETLSGVNTIRAYNSTKRFIAESNHRVDTNQRCYYPSFISNRWLAIRLELCGNLILFFSSVFAVMNREYFQQHPGTAGLILSYALTVTSTLNWLVRMTSELETNIVSVERIDEYRTNPTEREWHRVVNADPVVAENWPFRGEIEFNEYSVRYREGLSLVLNNISVNVASGEKIGIVGRTGAGKSSLTLSLFRLLEAANGKIVIDGIDISKIGLHELRSKLSIIPQDPILFSGTIRSNLDPFNTKSDDLLWKALEHSHLKVYISSLESGLDYPVVENGENLSVGQRQLICLARALLRKTKILILDEATAAVDLETDSLIQSTIRNEFADCTILTIAHRLHTILDSTRVLVLDRGQVVEFDSPSVLLADRRSRFYALAKDSRII